VYALHGYIGNPELGAHFNQDIMAPLTHQPTETLGDGVDAAEVELEEEQAGEDEDTVQLGAFFDVMMMSTDDPGAL
jgi:hypothetical protein